MIKKQNVKVKITDIANNILLNGTFNIRIKNYRIEILIDYPTFKKLESEDKGYMLFNDMVITINDMNVKPIIYYFLLEEPISDNDNRREFFKFLNGSDKYIEEEMYIVHRRKRDFTTEHLTIEFDNIEYSIIDYIIYCQKIYDKAIRQKINIFKQNLPEIIEFNSTKEVLQLNIREKDDDDGFVFEYLDCNNKSIINFESYDDINSYEISEIYGNMLNINKQVKILQF